MNLNNHRKIMGILNVSPDSFFDGGQYQQLEMALSQVQKMINDGAHIIDIGGESSRPGSSPVTLEEEQKRVFPILKEIKSTFPKILLSVDTYKTEIAKTAVEIGVDIINDIFGLRQPGMAEVAADSGAYAVIMHMMGEPRSMQANPLDKNAVAAVFDFFSRQIDFALKKGISEDKIILDPGIGFGKTLNGNVLLIKNTQEFKKLGFPVLIGASRKSMIGAMLNNEVSERKNGSVVLHTLALTYGADILRVHDVKETAEALKIFEVFQKVNV